jgi:hypothetical protein
MAANCLFAGLEQGHVVVVDTLPGPIEPANGGRIEARYYGRHGGEIVQGPTALSYHQHPPSSKHRTHIGHMNCMLDSFRPLGQILLAENASGKPKLYLFE